MLIDLSCPAEVFRYTMPTADVPAVTLLLYNLSDRVIVSVEVTLWLTGAGNAEKERVTYRGRALNGRPHTTFSMNVPCPYSPGAKKADMTIDKVWFNDNSVWRRVALSSTEYTPNNLPISKALTNLKFAAGETAVGYPSQQDGLWVCVCGRPNPDREEICARCRRGKDLVFTRFNREAVEMQVNQRERQLDLSTRSAREDTARMQRIREEEFNKKKARRKRRIYLFIVLVSFLAVFAGVLCGVSPALRLWEAAQDMSARNWTEAEETLRELGTFPGAEARLAECEWEMIKQQARLAGTPEKLREAIAALRAWPETEESVALAEKLEARLGRILAMKEKTDEAREAVSRLGETDERRIQVEKDCLFLEANKLLRKEKYTEAREIFLALGSYPGAATLAAECIYRPAVRMIADGRYDEAISELSRIPDYADSRARVRECHYRKAQIAEEEGDLETAAAEYLRAGNYEDAETKTQETVFRLAEDAFARGDLAEAQRLYASLPGYEPAAGRTRDCTYQLAEQRVQEKQYDEAIDLLSTLPADYEGRNELAARAAYLAGTAAVKKKEWAAAITYLEIAGDYRDAKARLEEAIERLAQDKLDAKDPEGAMILLERIPDSKNYAKMKKEADYLSAVAAAEAGEDPEKCIERFRELGKYQDAETWILRMYYEMAKAAEERGETLRSAGLYEQAEGWSDAKEKAESQYDRYYSERAAAAQEAADSGDYMLAVTLLETLNRDQLPQKYRYLDDLYEECLLQAGIQLYRDGRPYEAREYFLMVQDKRKAERWLQQTCYKIPGTWLNRAGEEIAVFREDNSCTIAGEEFTFLVSDSFTILTGPPEGGELTATFRISNLTGTRMTLRDMRSDELRSWDLFKLEGSGTEKTETEETPETEEAEEPLGDYTVKDGD